MMEFTDVITALTTLLSDNAQSRFRVINVEEQSESAEALKDGFRRVAVIYTDGSFPKNKCSTDQQLHEMKVDIVMSASAATKADVSILSNDAAEPQAKAAALLAIQTAEIIADRKLDEVAGYVWAILRNAINRDLGLPRGFVSSVHIESLKKDSTLRYGDLVVRTGNFSFTCQVEELTTGDLGIRTIPTIINSDVPAYDEPGAGVIVNNS
jgi:hypothetical protein